MNNYDIVELLKNYADFDCEIKTIATYRNLVFYLKYHGRGVYVKFCSQHSDPSNLIKEKYILTMLQKVASLSIPKIVKDFPSKFNDLPMLATYELPGQIIRNLPRDKRREALLSWVKTKKKLHETTLQCFLRDKFKYSIEPIDDMYLYFADRWRKGLFESKSFAPDVICTALQHLDELIKIVSNNYKKCLIQGDASLENALYDNNGSVGLIDFEKAIMGDPLWDIFGTVRDQTLIEEYEIDIENEVCQDTKLSEIKRTIKAVKALAAIGWLSNLAISYEGLRGGHFPNVRFKDIVELGEKQLYKVLNELE
jgi:thiamine kinase-like enzyme